MRLVVLALVGCAHAANPFGVDPFIGTGGGDPNAPISKGPGNTFPGAVVPWGMVSVSPHNDPKAPSKYTFDKPNISGFGHVHLSGVGCPDLGEVVLSATLGDADPASPYSGERAHPGYYAVRLDRFGIVAELSATPRAGISRFTFPAGDARLSFDRGRVVSPTEIEGTSEGGGFCSQSNRHTVHFVARFSQPAATRGPNWLGFRTAAGERITVAVGVSYVSIEGARRNLDREIPTLDFEAVRHAAERDWTAALSRVRIEGGTPEQRTVFYTALYHMLIHPNVFSDVDGAYIAMRRSGVRFARDYTRHTVYSLWDTYRTLHPFLTLVYPERQRDMVRSMVEMYRESGWLPKWELAGDETHVMVGDPAVIVIADSYLRGLRGFDVDAAWEAVHKHTMLAQDNDVRPGHAAYLARGFIPQDDAGIFGSVATALEYSLADYAAGRFAAALGEPDAAALLARSHAWESTFDGQLQHPRKRDGAWLAPFDPFATCCDKPWPESGGPGFVEGSAWQYTFFVPHDVERLVARLGAARFAANLQALFDRHRFDLGNEPDFAHPYLFTHVAGEEARTQPLVRALLAEFRDTPDGLPGNDDAGALSAWYVWSALGLYPTCPASNQYDLGSPLFDRATIGNLTIVRRTGRGPHHVDHAMVARGGTLIINVLPER